MPIIGLSSGQPLFARGRDARTRAHRPNSSRLREEQVGTVTEFSRSWPHVHHGERTRRRPIRAERGCFRREPSKNVWPRELARRWLAKLHGRRLRRGVMSQVCGGVPRAKVAAPAEG